MKIEVADAPPTRICPKRGNPVRLERRSHPMKPVAVFVHDDYWVCTNNDCGYTAVAE